MHLAPVTDTVENHCFGTSTGTQKVFIYKKHCLALLHHRGNACSTPPGKFPMCEVCFSPFCAGVKLQVSCKAEN